MPDCMMPFPEDWHEFLKDYSFDDSQEVYTNGSRLIPVFRVEQLIAHLLKAQKPMKPIENAGFYYCGACRYAFTSARQKYCSECGQAVKWDG